MIGLLVKAYCNATKEQIPAAARKTLPTKTPTQLDSQGDPVTDKYAGALDFSGTDRSQLNVDIW